MENSKLKNCKVCGMEIAKSAKTCPHCGAKLKKRHPLLIGLAVLIVFSALAGSSGDSDEPKKVENAGTVQSSAAVTPVQNEYQLVKIEEMKSSLESNALKAEKTYQDMYIEVAGHLQTIDSDGDYVTITATDDTFDLIGLHCEITDDAQIDFILEKTVGDEVTVKGQVTNIGEVLGYVVEIHEIY